MHGWNDDDRLKVSLLAEAYDGFESFSSGEKLLPMLFSHGRCEVADAELTFPAGQDVVCRRLEILALFGEETLYFFQYFDESSAQAKQRSLLEGVVAEEQCACSLPVVEIYDGGGVENGVVLQVLLFAVF